MTMFEVTENSTYESDVIDHVQAIFGKAKMLKERGEELTASEKKNRVGTRWENQPITKEFQVRGLSEVGQNYRDNMAELEIDGVSISERYIAAIQAQKAEVEDRMEGFAEHQASNSRYPSVIRASQTCEGFDFCRHKRLSQALKACPNTA
jgi:hypothetical protein